MLFRASIKRLLAESTSREEKYAASLVWMEKVSLEEMLLPDLCSKVTLKITYWIFAHYEVKSG